MCAANAGEDAPFSVALVGFFGLLCQNITQLQHRLPHLCALASSLYIMTITERTGVGVYSIVSHALLMLILSRVHTTPHKSSVIQFCSRSPPGLARTQGLYDLSFVQPVPGSSVPPFCLSNT